jgi:hypothetical protein
MVAQYHHGQPLSYLSNLHQGQYNLLLFCYSGVWVCPLFRFSPFECSGDGLEVTARLPLPYLHHLIQSRHDLIVRVVLVLTTAEWCTQAAR